MQVHFTPARKLGLGVTVSCTPILACGINTYTCMYTNRCYHMLLTLSKKSIFQHSQMWKWSIVSCKMHINVFFMKSKYDEYIYELFCCSHLTRRERKLRLPVTFNYCQRNGNLMQLNHFRSVPFVINRTVWLLINFQSFGTVRHGVFKLSTPIISQFEPCYLDYNIIS